MTEDNTEKYKISRHAMGKETNRTMLMIHVVLDLNKKVEETKAV